MELRIHHKKNWKDYFLKFLMVFLAVTLGLMLIQNSVTGF